MEGTSGMLCESTPTTNGIGAQTYLHQQVIEETAGKGGATHAVIDGGSTGMNMCCHFRGNSSWSSPKTQDDNRLGDVDVTMTRRSMRRPGTA